ncbi:MAG: hypothetical protein M1836_001664 [Candelina mexicana]|nr:MAG: hypothetical protein M1836_001664 [Candelina mexicana]
MQSALDPKEQPILASVLAIRDRLLILKEDRSTYIKSKDVIQLYDQVIEQLQCLNVVRAERKSEQNRVDAVLDDCLQLISLFYLTIGRKNEAPAVYSMTTTTKVGKLGIVFQDIANPTQRLLDHLEEAAFYLPKDLQSISHTIDAMRDTLKRGADTYSSHLLALLKSRLARCQESLSTLQRSLSGLAPNLTSVHEKLVTILRAVAAANTRQNFPITEVRDLKDQLLEIQASGQDRGFLAADRSPQRGQDVVTRLLERCLQAADLVLERQGAIDEPFRPIYDKLIFIRNQLEKLSLTQAWSLRETDLYDFQRQLDRVDEARVNGNFLDARGNSADLHAQRTLLYLLRRSYAYIYGLIISSEPVSEALLPVFNQLQTLRRCLVEVKKSGGVSSSRELYPYSMKLQSIEKMRVDGKFMFAGEIPEGQGSVNALLAECYELSYHLRTETENED